MAAAWLPHAGEAVRLQARCGLRPLGAGLATAAPSKRAEEVLDVVPVLVGDDVALCQRAALAPKRERPREEVEVDIDQLVGRAVEGPSRRRRRPQPLDVAPEKRTVSDGLVLPARRREGVLPVDLDAG